MRLGYKPQASEHFAMTGGLHRAPGPLKYSVSIVQRHAAIVRQITA